MMEISFEGKRALVTGASRGIGRAVALQLAKCGAKVYAVARNKTLLDSLKIEVPSIEVISVDLSKWNETREALKDLGQIDLLVNNAGIVILEPFTEASEEHVNRLFDINLKAAINVTQMITQDMLTRKIPGSVVMVSSQTAKIGFPDHSIYCGTKGGLDAFMRASALELGSHNIRVNSVNPTVIMTDMGKIGFSNKEKARDMMDKIPLKRFGEVEEVVDAVLYLLSDKASMVTGTSLLVDGGYVAV